VSADALRARLREAEPDLEGDRLDSLLQRVQGEPEVLEVAEQWASTGTWPQQPEIRRWTPRSIGDFLPPSSVLSALLHLREDPMGAAIALGEMYVAAHPPTGTASTDPFHDGWPFDRDRRDPDAGGRGQDA
jgi:hypothetical protein